MDDSDFTPSTMRLLIAFCHQAHLDGLDGGDQQRWREFVIGAHLDGAPDWNLSRLLQRRWPPEAEALAVKMGADYSAQRRLLQSYDSVLARQQRR